MIPQQGVGAELGVFKGEFSIYLLDICRPTKLYLIDTWWERYGEYFPDWGEYTDFGRMKTKDAYQAAVAVIEAHPLSPNVSFCVGDDLEILQKFPDHHLDWAYIDSSHKYPHTIQELALLDRIIQPDGLIAGHDFWENPKHPHHGVVRAVKEFCARSRWELIHLDNHSNWCIRRSP